MATHHRNVSSVSGRSGGSDRFHSPTRPNAFYELPSPAREEHFDAKEFSVNPVAVKAFSDVQPEVIDDLLHIRERLIQMSAADAHRDEKIADYFSKELLYSQGDHGIVDRAVLTNLETAMTQTEISSQNFTQEAKALASDVYVYICSTSFFLLI